MVRRQIDLDEETDSLLAQLASDYEGDLGRALADVLHAHASIESFLHEWEEASDSLRRQKERAEAGFQEGRSTPWNEVKRRNKLWTA